MRKQLGDGLVVSHKCIICWIITKKAFKGASRARHSRPWVGHTLSLRWTLEPFFDRGGGGATHQSLLRLIPYFIFWHTFTLVYNNYSTELTHPEFAHISSKFGEGSIANHASRTSRVLVLIIFIWKKPNHTLRIASPVSEHIPDAALSDRVVTICGLVPFQLFFRFLFQNMHYVTRRTLSIKLVY